VHRLWFLFLLFRFDLRDKGFLLVLAQRLVNKANIKEKPKELYSKLSTSVTSLAGCRFGERRSVVWFWIRKSSNILLFQVKVSKCNGIKCIKPVTNRVSARSRTSGRDGYRNTRTISVDT